MGDRFGMIMYFMRCFGSWSMNYIPHRRDAQMLQAGVYRTLKGITIQNSVEWLSINVMFC